MDRNSRVAVHRTSCSERCPGPVPPVAGRLVAGWGTGLLQGAIGRSQCLQGGWHGRKELGRRRMRTWAMLPPPGDGGSCPPEWPPVVGSGGRCAGSGRFMARCAGVGCCCERLGMVLGGLG